MQKIVILILLVSFLSATSKSLVRADRESGGKVALIIGNKSYSEAKLKNTINDARDMRKFLKSLDFDIVYAEDADRYKMFDKIDEFNRKLRGSKIAVVYFSGHGTEVDGKNYLIPIGSFNSSSKIKRDAISLSRDILANLSQDEKRFNLVILDACRNNPFKGSKGGSNGLGNVEAEGTLILYATKAGSVASDKSIGNNGLFTHYLLEEMKKPQDINDIAKNTAYRVKKASKGEQFPWLSGMYLGNFYFISNNQPQTEESVFSFESQKRELFKLNVNTTPSDAIVRILNIAPKYYDGIELKKGKYNIEVSKDDYITKKGFIELKGDLSVNVELEKEEVINTYSEVVSESTNKDTWKDPDTNLMWQVPIDTKEYNWRDAKNYCSNLNLGGYSDWRLPTKKELNSLGNIELYGEYDDSNWDKWFKTNKHKRNKNSEGDYHFIKKEMVENMPVYSWFWSSSEADSSGAWLVSFFRGHDGWRDKTGKSYVLCLR